MRRAFLTCSLLFYAQLTKIDVIGEDETAAWAAEIFGEPGRHQQETINGCGPCGICTSVFECERMGTRSEVYRDRSQPLQPEVFSIGRACLRLASEIVAIKAPA